MIDIEKLKALVSDVLKEYPDGTWYRQEHLAARAVDPSAAALMAELKPAAVLEVIARIKHMESEIEGLRHGWYTEVDTLCFWPEQLQEARQERDQLKAENEAMLKFMAEISQSSGDSWAVMVARQFLKVPGYE